MLDVFMDLGQERPMDARALVMRRVVTEVAGQEVVDGARSVSSKRRSGSSANSRRDARKWPMTCASKR